MKNRKGSVYIGTARCLSHLMLSALITKLQLNQQIKRIDKCIFRSSLNSIVEKNSKFVGQQTRQNISKADALAL